MYRQCSCLYRYSVYIFNIGTYSDPYTSIGATLLKSLSIMHIYSSSIRTISVPQCIVPPLSVSQLVRDNEYESSPYSPHEREPNL